MKQLILIFSGTYMFLLSGCLAPVNSVNDNASLLKKNEVKVSGSYSTYYIKTDSYDKNDNETTELVNTNKNFGASIAYGVSERFNVGLRYERLAAMQENTEDVNYLELGSKFRIIEDKIALGVPLGFYIGSEGRFIAALNPRLILTFSNSDKFEFNITPKTHIFLHGDIIPGISASLGFSSDLKKWAIRPEIGYDRYFSMGIGFSTKL